jgi:hypothetical protein
MSIQDPERCSNMYARVKTDSVVTTMPNIANGQVAFHFFQNTTKLDLAASR